MNDAVHEVRDPVYGFVRLAKREWHVVNSPVFQRLRDIKQLAMGHMVYPGATHTRFEHSIGCLHLSTLVLDHLREKCSETLASEYNITDDNYARVRRILRLAALLHDVGHPPFSHSGEDLLPERPVLAMGSGSARMRKVDHEEMTVRLIRESELGEVIRTEFREDGITPEDVIAVATKPSEARDRTAGALHMILNTLLTGDLGSDRIDYLLRDAYHSGQKTGEFDYRRLVATMTLVPPPEEEEQSTLIGVDEAGWLVAEQMIVARYLMYIALYFHKTKRIYEKHLESFMRAWLADKGGHLPWDLPGYLSLSDSSVIAGIQQAVVDPSAPGHADARRFSNRNHMRLAQEMILADNFVLVGGRRTPDRERFGRMGLMVSRKFGTMAVVVDAPDHSATKMFDKSRIRVLLDGKTRFLDDISEIVRGMSANIWRGRIYADRQQCQAVRTACEEWLVDHKMKRSKKR